MAKEKINIKYLRNAVDRTFTKRKFKDDVSNSFEIVKNSKILKMKWNAYSKKNKCANEVSYTDVVKSIEKIIEMIEIVEV